MKKIVLACFWHQETNLGDRSYVETFRKLVDLYTEDVSIELCDFYARKPVVKTSTKASQNYNLTKASKLKKFVKSKIPKNIKRFVTGTSIYNSIQKSRMRKSKYNRIYRYYQEKLKDADALIIPGGGLVEYTSWRDYHLLIKMLQKVCKSNNTDMYINSIGYVPCESPKKWRRKWRKIFNDKSVKYFSCRDNLLEFKKLRANTRQIPCFASLSSNVFNISKDNKSDIIGIGLIRYDAFSDYGNNLSKEFLLEYYKNVIEGILNKGYRVALFSMGIVRDQTFAEDVFKYVNNKSVILYERPTDVDTLLKQIATFKSILTVRTHSAYAAFSLNIPAIMVYFGTGGWEGKSTEFMKMMGVPQNAVCCDNVSPEELVDKLGKTIKTGWNKEVMLEKKKMCYQNFFEIMDKIGVLKSDVNKEKI